MNGNITLRVTWADGSVHEVTDLTRRIAYTIADTIIKLYPEDKVEIIDNNQ